jgi:DnaJ-class molecular chaperone
MSGKNADAAPAAGGQGATRLKPGDEAAPGTPGTGENICPQCHGSGRLNGQSCPNCRGTGRITSGIAGG